jgi:hypothetical protein
LRFAFFNKTSLTYQKKKVSSCTQASSEKQLRFFFPDKQ